MAFLPVLSQAFYFSSLTLLSVGVDGCGHAGTIQNVFNDFIRPGVERIDGNELWGCLSFILMQEGRAMHGAEWMSVGNDGMVGMFYLHSIYYVLSRLFTRDGERMKLPIYLPLS